MKELVYVSNGLSQSHLFPFLFPPPRIEHRALSPSANTSAKPATSGRSIVLLCTVQFKKNSVPFGLYGLGKTKYCSSRTKYQTPLKKFFRHTKGLRAYNKIWRSIGDFLTPPNRVAPLFLKWHLRWSRYCDLSQFLLFWVDFWYYFYASTLTSLSTTPQSSKKKT